MSNGIEKKVVIIAGASSGLGEATTRRLARDGARLVCDHGYASGLVPLGSIVSGAEFLKELDEVDAVRVEAME